MSPTKNSRYHTCTSDDTMKLNDGDDWESGEVEDVDETEKCTCI